MRYFIAFYTLYRNGDGSASVVGDFCLEQDTFLNKKEVIDRSMINAGFVIGDEIAITGIHEFKSKEDYDEWIKQ